MNLRKLKNCLIGLLLLGVVPANVVHAQQEERDLTPFDISVTPPTAYLKINPGNNAVHTITIKNNGTEELMVTPEMVEFFADGVTGHPTLSTSHQFPYLDQDRTSFDPLTLPTGATAQLTLHFAVPATAEDREYPLTILFRAERSKPSADPSLTPISGKIGSNIVVLVSDSEFLENVFTVESFGGKMFIDSFGRLEFSPQVKNNSYAAAVASGSATLSNWRGKEIAKYDISPSAVLGFSSRNIEPMSSVESIQDDNGLRLFVHDSPFLIGPYSFSVFLPSGDPNNPIYTEQKIIVWAVPFVLLGTIAITCFALGGYYYYRKRSSIA